MELGNNVGRSTILHWSNTTRDSTPIPMYNSVRTSCQVGGVDWNSVNLYTQTG